MDKFNREMLKKALADKTIESCTISLEGKFAFRDVAINSLEYDESANVLYVLAVNEYTDYDDDTLDIDIYLDDDVLVDVYPVNVAHYENGELIEEFTG